MTLTVDLGTAIQFGVLATTAISSVGDSIIHGGDIGVDVGGAITGFPPGIITDGQIASATAVQQAHIDLSAAYTEVQSRSTVSAILLPAEIGSLTLTPNLYYNTGAVTLATGNLILSGAGVYVFQLTAALSAAVSIVLTAGAASDQVFWQVGGAFSLAAGAEFQGTLLCNAAVGIGANTTVKGRLFTRAGAVALSTTALTCPDEAQRLALIAATQQSSFLTQSLSTHTFRVEMPDGSVLSGVHNFGDSLIEMVQRVLESDLQVLCSQANLSWQLADNRDLLTIDAFHQLLSDHLLTLKPVHHQGQIRVESSVSPVNKMDMEFKSEYTDSVICVDKRYCVRFYQREINGWWNLHDLEQVWLDVNNEFIAPVAKMDSISGPVRIVTCSLDQYKASQLPI